MRSTWANAFKRKARDDGKSSLLKPPKKNKTKRTPCEQFRDPEPRRGPKIWDRENLKQERI